MRGGNDAYNDRQAAKRADLPPADLLAEFETNRAATIAAVEAAAEPLFARPIRSAGGTSACAPTGLQQVAVLHSSPRPRYA